MAISTDEGLPLYGESPDEDEIKEQEPTAKKAEELASSGVPPSSETPQRENDSAQESSKPARARSSRRRAGRPVSNLGLKPYAYAFGIILGLILVLYVFSGTAKLILAALLLLAAVVKATPKVLDRFWPKIHNPPKVAPKRYARGVYWKLLGQSLYARFGWEWLAKLSWRERDYNSRSGLWENRWVQKTLGFFNSKGGGGKTTGATWFAVIWAFFTKRHIVAMDVNHSPGGTAKRLGIKRNQTVQLREFLELCVVSVQAGALMAYEKFATLVHWHHEADVSVIASESRSNKPLWDHLILGIVTAKSVAHGLVCDVGNSIAFVNDLVTFFKADTPVFVANLRTGDSLDDMAATMKEYRDLGFKDKVSKSIVVIFGGKLRHRKRYAKRYERFGITLEQVHVVPFNRYMQNSNTDPDSDRTKTVSRMKVPRIVRVTLQEALLATLLAEPSSDKVNESALKEIATSQGPLNIDPILQPAPAGND